LGPVPTFRESPVTKRGQDAESSPAHQPEVSSDVNASLLQALTGRDANRDRATALRTRRVVIGSLGVLKDQKKDKSRARAMALAVGVILLLLITPLAWEATDSLIAGEHLGDISNQWSLWALLVCPTLLGAVMVAGWWRRRS
jgi:hypothetical protein